MTAQNSATKNATAQNFHYDVLFAGNFDGQDMYAVFKVAAGIVRQASSCFANVSRANERAKEFGERDGVQWFGR